MLVYGPPGAGKKTPIMALLREAFGGSSEKVPLRPLLLAPARADTIAAAQSRAPELEGMALLELPIAHPLRSFPQPPSSQASVDYTTVSSNHHIEINPSDVGVYDRVIVQVPVVRLLSALA